MNFGLPDILSTRLFFLTLFGPKEEIVVNLYEWFKKHLKDNNTLFFFNNKTVHVKLIEILQFRHSKFYFSVTVQINGFFFLTLAFFVKSQSTHFCNPTTLMTIWCWEMKYIRTSFLRIMKLKNSSNLDFYCWLGKGVRVSILTILHDLLELLNILFASKKLHKWQKMSVFYFWLRMNFCFFLFNVSGWVKSADKYEEYTYTILINL